MSKKKNKEKCFNILEGDVFEITINPNDKMQHFLGGKWRLLRFYEKVQPFLHKHLKRYQYKLYLDLSLPHINVHLQEYRGKQPRLHYHGTISFTKPDDRFHFFITTLPKLATVCNVTINDLREEWKAYCKKLPLESICKSYEISRSITHNTPPFKRVNEGLILIKHRKNKYT